MNACLQKGVDARKHALNLGNIDYTGDLNQKLLQFSSKMERVFQLMQNLRDQGETSETMFTGHLKIIDEKLAWYEKAEASDAPADLGNGRCLSFSSLDHILVNRTLGLLGK